VTILISIYRITKISLVYLSLSLSLSLRDRYFIINSFSAKAVSTLRWRKEPWRLRADTSAIFTTAPVFQTIREF